MIRRLLVFISLVFIVANTQAQVLQSSTYLGHRSKQQLIDQFGLPLFTNGVNLYKVVYSTPDVNGDPSLASGLLCVPDVLTKKYPVLCYQHGTSSDREDVPSRLNGEADLPILFCGMGYLTVAPDYLGLGDSPGYHPYVHAETEASAGVDMIRAGREFAQQEGVAFNEQVFVTGYSQGGHAAMALHRKLETELSSEFQVAAASPMSGPYSIGEVMRELILQEEVYYFPAYIPNTIVGYQTAYGNLYNDLTDVFKPEYAALIQKYIDEEVDLFNLNLGLIFALQTQEGASIPVKMMYQAVVDSVMSDSLHPINLALKDNNVYDWAPQAPTRLVYCMNDDQVPFENALLAESVMQANGAAEVNAYDPYPSGDHGSCVEPAVFYTVLFFSTHQQVEDLPTATTEVVTHDLNIFPNPAQNTIRLDHSASDGTLTISAMNGQVLMAKAYNTGESIDVSELPEGMYLIEVQSADEIAIAKLMIQK
jgi:pimeloyl-ACP methyl ester carboxylesterase